MKHLSILVPEGDNNLSSIVGPHKIFTRANAHWRQEHGEHRFHIQLVGLSERVDFYQAAFSVRPETTIDEVDETDLIIVPSLNHSFADSVPRNRALAEWIERRYKGGAEVASICTGAFLLASTGLLDGRSCSTHWSAAEDFRLRFPRVHLKADRIITDEHGIYTSGGAYSFLNLIIYLVEKYFDRATAIYCSKVFQIEIDRRSQAGFMIFNGHRKHVDETVHRAQTWIEENYEDKVSVEELADRFHLNRRTFDRRFQRATGLTPLDYIQRVKVEAAKKALEATRKSVSEIMYDVGYNDNKAFRTVFQRVTGMTPVAYQGRYRR